MDVSDSPVLQKTFRQHLRATLTLGLPLVGAQLAQMMIGVTDTIMLGWLGTEELAAGTLAGQTYFIFLIFGLGFGGAMTPLIGNALGRNDAVSVRRVTRMGMWALVGLAFLFLIPLWFVREILTLMGQKEELAYLAQDYMRIAQWSMVPAFVLIGIRAFLTSLEKATIVLIITVLAALLNGILNYTLIFGNFGAPRLGIEGAAWATLITNLAAAVISLIYLSRSATARPYTLFVNPWRPDREALRRVVKLGIPISLSIFAEAGLFSAATIMIGWLGTVSLAAHGIALQIASVTFMVPLGLAQAASVRVSNAAGREDKQAVGLAGNSAVLLGLGFAILAALMFWLFPEPLINSFIDETNPDVNSILAYGVTLLAVAAAFQIFDALQVVSSGNLRGLQDTEIPLFIAVVSYWVIGLSCAYIFGFVAGFDGMGVWAGLVTGLMAAAIALTWRFAIREKIGLI